MSDVETSSLSFFSKKPTACPICEANFYKEDLRTGRGRLIAGDLTEELRRLYEPSKKYGAVYPLIYPVMVCPKCYYAAYPMDFSEIQEPTKNKIEEDTDRRISSIQLIFPELEFEQHRTLKEGAASYFLAIMCYDFFPPEKSPTIKRAISALRGAWLFNDLDQNFPLENYDYLSKLFYRKARFFYILSVEYEQSGKEGMASIPNLGPDLDKNYGYDGVLYLSAYLEYKYGPRKDTEMRKTYLNNAKRTLSRIFGMGKASKNKPSILLDLARDVRTKITEEIEEEGENGST
ncbi:MAG: DUF2225 domain-containing protein [Spirochaetes bacterium]|nr:MAG: DUF2225 domain-containing protein [Spirochaetota bacterium]